MGHIGSALSVADIIWTLYEHILRIQSPRHSDRDRFILGKGHAALALYAALRLQDRISQKTLDSYCTDGSCLGVHPERSFEWIDFATGSLGQGLSFGVGAALAARLQESKRRVFVLISDAECNEGAVWESVMFAAQHSLANLTVIVDCNGQQAFGYTKEILDLSPLSEKFKVFGWDTHDIDGHDIEGMHQKLHCLDYVQGRPHVLVARTTFGKGVSFMENRIAWHYLPLSDEQHTLALAEVGQL